MNEKFKNNKGINKVSFPESFRPAVVRHGDYFILISSSTVIIFPYPPTPRTWFFQANSKLEAMVKVKNDRHLYLEVLAVSEKNYFFVYFFTKITCLLLLMCAFSYFRCVITWEQQQRKPFFANTGFFFSRNSTKHNLLKVFVPLWYNSKLFHTDWLLSVHCFSISTHAPRTWSIQDILAMTKLEVKKFQKL